MVSASSASPAEQRRAPRPVGAPLLQKLLASQPSGFTRDTAEGGVAFTYGELSLEGVEALLRDAMRRRQQADVAPPRCFLDLGSGTGRVVLCAAALFPELECCIGVELSEERHSIALQGREAASAGAPDALLGDRVVFLHGDARASVAPIAAADVIWVSNTCFPEELNSEVSAAIADNANDGALVYATAALHLGDREGGGRPVDEVPIGCSWTLAHRALVYALADLPRYSAGLGDTEEAAVRRAFEHWASGYTAGPEEYCVLEGEHVEAALATALLLAGAPPRRTLDLLHTEGALREALRESWSAAALTDAGMDAETFEELCGQCWELALPPGPSRCGEARCGGCFSLFGQ